MGSTISKTKQKLQFKTFVSQARTPSAPCSTKTAIQSSTLVLVRSQNKSASRARKSKHRRHHHVGKVSVQSKRAKPKYKRVTKSIIGKPTNFKHTGHMGAGDILESSVDTMALSNELNGIASQINCFESPVQKRELVPHDITVQMPTPQEESGFLSVPPPPPPHLYISTSAKKRAASKEMVNGAPYSVPVSFRRRQYRKAVSRHHPNLDLVGALMIQTPTLRSLTAA